jgi:hypothetical protein
MKINKNKILKYFLMVLTPDLFIKNKILKYLLRALGSYFIIQLILIEIRFHYHPEVICGEVTEIVRSSMKGYPSIIVKKGDDKYEFYQYLMNQNYDFVKQIEIGDRVIKLSSGFHLLLIKKNGDRLFIPGSGGDNNWFYNIFLMPQIPNKEDYLKWKCN